ncbi:jerky protein homolog [Haliotis rubra]|uniref:jerky protein homolog n=1 Tax=Haliotis rubra TaxID=36100 RepID=UPI001EE5059A|nr:jerky protein homolog [Haliotis rubra]
MSRPAKRARCELTLQQKVQLIEDFDKTPRPTQKALASTYGIGRQTVSDILKRRDHYIKKLEINMNDQAKRVLENSKFDKINTMTHEWFMAARSKSLPISGPILKEKAVQFAQNLDINDFKASDGWLTSWKTRYSIKQFKVSGESASVNADDVATFKSRLPDLTDGYSAGDIFNCDQTGLFFRALPTKLLLPNYMQQKVGKCRKND